MDLHDEKYKAVSIYTIFGQNSSLGKINDKLYDSGLHFYGDLDLISEKQFWRIVSRTSEGNKKKIKNILNIFPPKFKSP